MFSNRLTPKNVYSTGSLVEANFANGFAIFTGYDLRPSDVRSAKITIENASSYADTLRLCEVEASNSFAIGDLSLLIVEEESSTEVYRGDIGEFPVAGVDLGRFEPSERRTYCFTVILAVDSPNGGQGRGAGAIYDWGAASERTSGNESCSKDPASSQRQ